MNICNHPLSERLGGVPIVSLHTGAPLMPISNSCARAPRAPRRLPSSRRRGLASNLALAPWQHGLRPVRSRQRGSTARLPRRMALAHIAVTRAVHRHPPPRARRRAARVRPTPITLTLP